ncbi:AlkA N-terminal domain-containing protein [Nocardioides sambongensis]|uniref:AlkA N-terminal domain-containing protein n=1 Tax=Nocardioides sambongensis TaxID=2589074 RepID=UPI00112BA34F|nr:AlkA N-terminal domain-containing protein [Nocardioides sambongensis]
MTSLATTAAALDPEACYAAVRSRDRRFDGVFYIAVSTTGIYCRPSCPARTPAAANVTFHRSAAAAQEAGYRACKRCLPDAVPGSPDWDVTATVAGRAMRLISDGVVDREGVDGLAGRLGYSNRHLGRLLRAELGAGPLALARTQRAQTARVLVETTELPFADIAFASGFRSVRQFNDTLREIYATTPSGLRGRRGAARRRESGSIALRLAVRAPFAGVALGRFLAVRAVTGVEQVEVAADRVVYRRTLRLPHAPGALRVDLVDVAAGEPAQLDVRLTLTDLRDTATALSRARRLVDADADPLAVAEHLARDPALAPLLARHPGLRVPGHVDGDELAVRAVLGQQVSVAGARTVAGRLVAETGTPYDSGVEGLTHLFPDAAAIADLDPASLPMPRARGRALTGLAGALADGRVVLDRGPDRDEVRRALLALPGIGPWTSDYIALRALGHPDVFLPTDVGVRHALAALGGASDTARWAPWRSYALLHLWTSLEPDPGRAQTERANTTCGQ